MIFTKNGRRWRVMTRVDGTAWLCLVGHQMYGIDSL